MIRRKRKHRFINDLLHADQNMVDIEFVYQTDDNWFSAIHEVLKAKDVPPQCCQFRSYIEEIIEVGSRFDLIVTARERSLMIGYALVQTKNDLMLPRGAKRAKDDDNVHAWYIELLCGHLGGGTHVLKAVERMAQDTGVTVIQLGALFDAIGYYMKRGYQIGYHNEPHISEDVLKFLATTRFTALEVNNIAKLSRHDDPENSKLFAVVHHLIQKGVTIYSIKHPKSHVKIAPSNGREDAAWALRIWDGVLMWKPIHPHKCLCNQ